MNPWARARRAVAVAASASVLSTSLLLVGATAVAADDCTVPSLPEHPTIQSAVDDPDCTTIYVDPGAYLEHVNVHRTVDIFGSDGTSVVTGSFTVNAPNVTIDGFTVHNATGNVGIVVKTAGSGSTISNNTLSEIGTAAGPDPVVAIYLERGPDNVSVLNNDISFVLSNRSAQGILVGDSTSDDPSLDILIAGNTITNITSATAATPIGGAYGIQINNGASEAADTDGYTTGVVRDNTISGLTGDWAHGIGLEGPTPGLEVYNNDISNLVDLVPVGTNEPINDAVAVFIQQNPDLDSVSINENNFDLTIGQWGIALHFTQAAGDNDVDGTCNWWGAPDGPGPAGDGSGARVSPGVDYSPWLVARDGACVGGNIAEDPDDCKDGGWMTRSREDGSTFKNQGDCIQYANTGK